MGQLTGHYCASMHIDKTFIDMTLSELFNLTSSAGFHVNGVTLKHAVYKGESVKKVATLLCMVALCAGLGFAQTSGGSSSSSGSTATSSAKPAKQKKAKAPKAKKAKKDSTAAPSK